MAIMTTISFMHDPLLKNGETEAFNDGMPLSDAIAYLQKVLKEQGDIEAFAKITYIRPPGHK